MGTILDSVKAMSEKLGVTEEAQTIAEQIDLNTEAISGTNPQSRDIAEAVESFNEAMPEPTPTYILLTEEPSDWSTGYSNYYTESSGEYIPVAGVDDYELTTEEPADWGTKYATYFTESSGTYTAVEGVDDYELTTEEPADWATNYTDYFTESGGVYTPVTGNTAPTWASNTYYSYEGKVAPTWASNTYYSYEGKVAPTFAANTYYRKDMWQ